MTSITWEDRPERLQGLGEHPLDSAGRVVELADESLAGGRTPVELCPAPIMIPMRNSPQAGLQVGVGPKFVHPHQLQYPGPFLIFYMT